VLTISPSGGDDPSCSYLRGTEEVAVHEESVQSSLIKNLRLAVSADGGVTGWGFETMTGWGAAAKLNGKRTPGGYAGDAVGERYGVYCYASWTLTGPRGPR
jgi:hypothetical protein